MTSEQARHEKILEQLNELSFVLDVYGKVPALIVVYNINTGEYIYVNESVKQLLGYSPDDFIDGGLAFAAGLVHPDDILSIMTSNAEALRLANKKGHPKDGQETIATFEYRMKDKHGSWRWIHSDGTVFSRDDAGKVELVMNVSVDITDRHNAENAAKQALEQEIVERKKKERELADVQRRIVSSEDHLALAMQAASMGSWEWNLENHGFKWSDQLRRIYNVPPDFELSYESIQKLTHPDDNERVKKITRQALKSGKPYEVEYRITWQDGSIHWVAAYGRVIKQKGKPVRMFGTLRNIDERKQAELQLKYSETKFKQLFDNAPDAIIVSSAQGKVLDANKAATSLLGYDVEEFFGLALSRLLRKRDLSDIRKLQRAEPTKTEYFTELQLHRKDGQYIYCEITARMLPDSTWLAFIRDISERAKQQEAVRESQVKEKVFQERAALLRQQHHQIMLLNKAKDEFLSVASHHLRTPVTAVKTYLAMLREGYAGKLSRGQIEYVEQAYESNEQQLQVIDDILNVAEIDTDQAVMQMKKYDLVRVAVQVVENLSDKFIARHQHIELKTSQPAINVKIDGVKFGLVLENLIGNASKYSPDGTRIHVRITELKHSVRIIVRDEGMGIAPDDIDKIFEKFARVRNQAYRSETGTGLGLYWAKRIIELHGGTISVKSTIKQGSTFIVYIPRYR